MKIYLNVCITVQRLKKKDFAIVVGWILVFLDYSTIIISYKNIIKAKLKPLWHISYPIYILPFFCIYHKKVERNNYS